MTHDYQRQLVRNMLRDRGLPCDDAAVSWVLRSALDAMGPLDTLADRLDGAVAAYAVELAGTG